MITAISITIAALGTILLLILFSRIRQVDAEYKLKKHRSKDEGLADLLAWAAVVDDGVIVSKNGSFIASWLYQGSDNASSTDEQRAAVSYRINQALSGLGNGWMVHIDAIRRPSPSYSPRGLSSFTDPVCEAIDEERRRLFEGLGTMYEGFFVVTLTWTPPRLSESKIVEMMFDDDMKATDESQQTSALINKFKSQIATFESYLSGALDVTRLKGHSVQTEHGEAVTHDDLLSWLQFCTTGENHPVVLPNNPMYIDSLIGAKEMWGGVIPKIGRKFIQVVAIDGFPMESAPGILSTLAEQPCEYRWSSRYIFMDTHEAEAHLNKYRKKWKQKVVGFFDQVFQTNSGNINQDALAMVADADAAIADLKSGLVSQGYYTSVVVLMDEDRKKLEESARTIEKAIMREGFNARIETINTMDAFFGSLPGHGVENVRRPLINTMNLADLMPTSTIWTGNDYAPCPKYPSRSPALMSCVTSGSTPFRLNLHVQDLGHTIMFGPTKAGKSTHLAMLVAQMRRYKDMNLFCFDKGMSLYALTKGAGGDHFSVASDEGSLAFCPLQYLETRSDRAWAMEWIDTILILNGVQTTPTQRNAIGHAITSMHESGAKTLSEFSTTIQDEEIRAAIHQYTIDGAMGHLLDADHDGLALSDFTTFEIEELMDLGEKFALPVLLYLFRRIERSLDGRPAAIVLDEAWLMLAHEAFRNKIKEWLKVLRKANCLVLMATQSLSDAMNSGILDIIVESTATKIFLPNIYAQDEMTAKLYYNMGLNSRQVQILSTAQPKRHYYFVSEEGRRLYELHLGPLALAFVAATDKESVNTIKSLEREFGDQWVHKWLSKKGLKLSDYVEGEAA